MPFVFFESFFKLHGLLDVMNVKTTIPKKDQKVLSVSYAFIRVHCVIVREDVFLIASFRDGNFYIFLVM